MSIPLWFRPRDEAELERERRQLEDMQALEQMQIEAGWKVRPEVEVNGDQ